MLLQPKETKFTKKRKGRIKSNYENKKNDLKFGTYGLYALEKGKITAAQIEAVRRTITNYTKRQVKI
jgi:large subunit ribosomal protein L16